MCGFGVVSVRTLGFAACFQVVSFRLYGPECGKYFLGALVLGEGLQRHGAGIPYVLLHTPDVPADYVHALTVQGWSCKQVEYVSQVSWSLFKRLGGQRADKSTYGT